jgi:hypothetical protein
MVLTVLFMAGCGDDLPAPPDAQAFPPLCAELHCLTLACSTSSEGPGNCTCEVAVGVFDRCQLR